MAHITTKELPPSERPYEKCLLEGPGSLSDAELLAVIIRSGGPEMNAVQLAQEILSAGGLGLLNLHQMSVEELTDYPGIGEVKAIRLKCVAELSSRIARTERKERVSLRDAQSVADYYMERMRHLPREQLLVSMFDVKCRLLGDSVIATGSVRAVLGSPRDIFLQVLEKKAVAFILLHNHPSGDPSPSREDIELTRRVNECAGLMDVELSDHIIIGDMRYYSFREHRLVLQ